MPSCAIMQPTYLPWSGYFGLIAAVDVFVLLDDVQYERKSWQCKNRILVDGAPRTIEVPVQKQPLTELIQNIRINHSKPWVANHSGLLEAAYGTHQHHQVMDTVLPILTAPVEGLSDLNEQLIRSLCLVLGIETPILLASELGCGGRRSEHVAEICHAVGADRYLSPLGARDYLEADGFAVNSGLRLDFQEFNAKPYQQRGAIEFVSHLSIVDVVANCGPDFARRYVMQDE